MTDYTTKTDAELDALAAERMHIQSMIAAHVRDGGRYWSPTTDANDRDEWVAWLVDRCAPITITRWPDGSVTATCKSAHYASGIATGRAVVIAGLRATDD